MTLVYASLGDLWRVRARGPGGVSEGTITSIGSMQRQRAERRQTQQAVGSDTLPTACLLSLSYNTLPEEAASCMSQSKQCRDSA